ncbi:hypothetical protein [Mycetocola spongiae]|uniref:hypothetical protein n=1 Tax=Mycetocola spongiae TaxID=2859226 RepID=UPI001CF12B95|nr:hypothetical protein [Mycetocola spongiae]UCR88619.1 hypothetical protein KXZ72_11725 [Mycetocola spongiae]
MAHVTRAWWGKGVAGAGLMVAAVLGFSGCAAETSVVTITYETEHGVERVSFFPRDLRCDWIGASGLGFAQKPFYQVDVLDASPGEVSAWVQDKKLILFVSKDPQIEAIPNGRGAIDYVVTATEGEVVVSDPIAMTEPETPTPTLADSDRYAGSIEMRVRCTGADVE